MKLLCYGWGVARTGALREPLLYLSGEIAPSLCKRTAVPAERGDLPISGPDEHLLITDYTIPYVRYGYQNLV
jgi:hypothetical protein